MMDQFHSKSLWWTSFIMMDHFHTTFVINSVPASRTHIPNMNSFW